VIGNVLAHAAPINYKFPLPIWLYVAAGGTAVLLSAPAAALAVESGEVIERRGLNATTEPGKASLRKYLEDRAAVVGSAVHASTLLNPNAELVDQVTIFRDRGLSSDTSILIDFGIERALADVKAWCTSSQSP